MKKTLLLSVLLVFSIFLFSKPVNIETAKKVAKNFLFTNQTSTFYKTSFSLELVYTSTSTENSQSVSKSNYFYVFNATENNGYVIIAADDDVSPVLGYSCQNTFNSENIPVNLAKWLESYKEEIRFIVKNKIAANAGIAEQWNDLKSGKENKTLFKKASVSPLVKTRWDQSPYYNALCPYDYSASDRTVTGCVATAMAQIMKFWEYPKSGTGFHSYNHSKYGTLSANFGSTNYNWSSMPTRVTSSNSAVATLMYHCGVSVNMNYGVAKNGGSGAYTQDVADALKEYFGYSSTVEAKFRDNYSESQWISMLKSELDAGRPIQYAGSGTNGGHSFVCDGYDNSNYFHMNWGWDGSSDGYFKISALNPGSLGTGGGSGGFNSNQKAIIGIKPPSGNVQSDLIISSDVYASSSSVNYGNAFTVYTNLTNKASNTFYGTYCAALFDEDDKFIEYIDSIEEKDGLPSNYTYTNDLQFKYKGSYTLLPGTYKVFIFYHVPNGNWTQIHSSGSFDETTTIKITYSSNIELYSDISLSPSIFIQGQNASATLNIANNGSTTFYGQYQVNLYNLDGTFAETINTYTENSGLPSKYSYKSPYIKFSSSNITSDPGTYLLAVIYKPNSSSSWILAGSSFFQNPIEVTISEPPINPDMYEVNDNKSQAYTLTTSFGGNNTILVKTTGSTCHTGTDYDYYKVSLIGGYNYKISARLQDNASSNDGKEYSLDAVFSYSTDGINWSDAYDEELGDFILLSGESAVYFMVSPYFTGETGTYQLDLQITRTINGNIKNINELSDLINLYPNPANNFIKIEFNNAKPVSDKVFVEDISGKTILMNLGNTIDVSALSKGIYYIKIETDKGLVTKKLFKY